MSNIDNPGSVFGNRYEIVSKIARGGMADVYRATDKLLDRPVALKVLFRELSTDPNFVERFRREAQNAARLTHPNIVSVYDWGEDGGTYYMVMEYVDGTSLSDLLKRAGHLSPERAAAVGADIAGALSFAHRNGVVHRDIKPGNVILDEHGLVKVTDFGIARARNSTDNLTQTGAVMGTATYFSPEQAQGIAVDQRSDVYSLGVVLYEMVTGSPPFDGDNPVAIAYKHVREQPAPLSQANQIIPPDFIAIVTQAMAKEAGNRYSNAEDMRSDLKRFLAGHHVKAAPSSPEIDNRTQIHSPIGTQSTNTQPPASLSGGFDTDTSYTQAVPAYADATRAVPVTPGPPRITPALPKDARSNIAGPLAIFLVLLAAVVGAGFWFIMSQRDTSETPTVEQVEVADVSDRTQAAADMVLREAGFTTRIQTEPSDETTGRVIRQDPRGGTKVDKGTEVLLVVSAGPDTIQIPNVTNQTSADARRQLERLGFEVTTTNESSTTVEAGRVISQSPSGSAARNATITLTVSTGPQKVEVPNAAGFTVETVASMLSRLGLRTELAPGANENSIVARTDPAAGTIVEFGNTVTLFPQATTTTSTTAPATTTSGLRPAPSLTTTTSPTTSTSTSTTIAGQ